MTTVWTPAAARQEAREEYDAKIAAIDKIAGVMASAEALSADWPDRQVYANFLSTSCYASLRLLIKPDQELGVAHDTFSAVEAKLLELGGVSMGLKDETSDWFIGKGESFRFGEGADMWLYFTVYVGRNHWIGEQDVEGAVCTRRQIGVTKQVVHKTEYVEKPAYEVFCPGAPS